MLITEVNERKGNKHFVCKICKSIGEGNERTEVVPGGQGRIGRVFFLVLIGEQLSMIIC